MEKKMDRNWKKRWLKAIEKSGEQKSFGGHLSCELCVQSLREAKRVGDKGGVCSCANCIISDYRANKYPTFIHKGSLPCAVVMRREFVIPVGRNPFTLERSRKLLKLLKEWLEMGVDEQ